VPPVVVSAICRLPGAILERKYIIFWFDNASRKHPITEVHIRNVQIENSRLREFKAAPESVVYIIEINSGVEPLTTLRSALKH